MAVFEELLPQMQRIVDLEYGLSTLDDKEYLVEEAPQSLERLFAWRVINEDTDYPSINSLEDFQRIINLEYLIRVSNMSLEEALEYAKTSIRNKGHGSAITIVPTDKCTKGCVHCNVDSTPKGSTLSFETLRNANEEILSHFRTVHFGIEGEALQTFDRDQGDRHFFSDYFRVLVEKGLRRFILDTKGIRPSEKRIMEEYRKIGDLVRAHEDIYFFQRISFNPYSPDVFGNIDKPNIVIPILTDELIPTLEEAVQFASRILINCAGTPYFQEAHTDTLLGYMEQILIENNYEPLTKERVTRPGEIQVVSSGIGSFGHRETGKEIEFRHSYTLNQGRWLEQKDSLTRLPTSNKRDASKRRSIICEGLLLNSFTLRPDGKIYLCGGDWTQYTDLGSIDQPFNTYMSNLERVHRDRSRYVRENLDLIVEGRDPSFRCGYNGETQPVRGKVRRNNIEFAESQFPEIKTKKEQLSIPHGLQITLGDGNKISLSDLLGGGFID